MTRRKTKADRDIDAEVSLLVERQLENTHVVTTAKLGVALVTLVIATFGTSFLGVATFDARLTVIEAHHVQDAEHWQAPKVNAVTIGKQQVTLADGMQRGFGLDERLSITEKSVIRNAETTTAIFNAITEIKGSLTSKVAGHTQEIERVRSSLDNRIMWFRELSTDVATLKEKAGMPRRIPRFSGER